MPPGSTAADKALLHRSGVDFGRAPALPLALAFGLGIALDRWLAFPWLCWMGAAVLLTAALLACRGDSRWNVRAALAVALFGLLGGARHHSAWSLRGGDDVSSVATDQPQLVDLVGRVRTPVEIIAADEDAFTPEWMRVDRSSCQVECVRLMWGETAVPVSGIVRLDVSGHVLHLRVGDEVRVVGQLARPSPPANPGAFDFGAWLRNRGIDCILRTDHPDAVQRLSRSVEFADHVANLRQRLREECQAVLIREVRTANVPVAASLLLGDRTRMTDEVSDQFANSGTMHLLAISGLHVGMLAGMLFVLCRALHLSPWGTAALLLITIGSYAFITDHRPPVMRAAVLAFVVVGALPGARRVSALNTLAISALVVLLWNPTDLFDVGAQLSFLAVLGILSASRLLAALDRRRIPDPLAPEETRASRLRGTVVRNLRDVYVVTAAIWLFTLPLTIARFNLVSPIGFVVNVALIPYSALVLGSGFLLLFVGLLAPGAAWLPGGVFDVLLEGMMRAVSVSASLPLGHFHLAGPPNWWIAGCYLLLAAGSGVLAGRRWRSWAWRGFAIWTAAGLAWGLRPIERDGLTCTFLSVGHGGAVAIELPDGATLLYDTGTIGAPTRARRTVTSALWSAGINTVDAVIVSHADMDHFNGVSGLLQSIPVGEVLLAQSALDFDQEGMAALCEDTVRFGVPLRLIQAGDILRADEQVQMEILHPGADDRDQLDNANSVVLRIEYAGRTILLTGDLEGRGLQTLLAWETGSIDVLQSPHHGSRAANPPALAAWAQPTYVVISTGDRGKAEELQPVYGEESRVLSTAESGAVRVRVSPAGVLTVDDYRQVPW